MSKKKKKGGKARAKRANPSPSKKEFKATPEFKTALGKGLLDFLTSAAANKVAPEPKPEETKEERIQRLLAEQKAAQEGPSNPPLSPLKTLNVRTPDGQRIMWSFSDDDPRSSPRQVKKAYLVMKENQEEEPSETILNQIDALVEGFEAHIEELREVLA